MIYSKRTFDSPGYLLFKLTDEELLPIRKFICDRIEKSGLSVTKEKIDPSKFIEMKDIDNSDLVRKEFSSYFEPGYNPKKEDLRLYMESILSSLVGDYHKEFGNLKGIEVSVLSNNRPFFLDDIFVNFTKKGHYSPIHDHPGVFNFVLWIQSPVDFDKEQTTLGDITWHNDNGKFSFYHINSLGKIDSHSLPIDKSFEGYGAFFPSSLNHIIHPFSKSDGYRIALVGTFKLRV